MNRKLKMINDKFTGALREPAYTTFRPLLWLLCLGASLFVSCENSAFTGTFGKEEEEVIPVVLTGEYVQKATLEEAFQYIKDNIKDGESYYIDAADFADATLYLPPAGKRYFTGINELSNPSVPNCMVYPLLKGVTISIINTGGEGKTIRLRMTSQNGHEYNSGDFGSLFYIDKKVD